MLNERNTLLEDDGIEEEILVEEECSVAQAVWGDIHGNIENQTDLQNALDAKQDSLTEAQLNAVNSGITAERVTTYDGYADQIASKADQSALNAEATTREQADTALGTRIDNEALARQNADNGLQTQIDAITSKSDVVDVVANYAALQAYDTSTLGNNDVVKVLDDETHEDALTYYRWSTTTQTWSYIGQEAPYYSKGQMDVKLAEKQDKLTAGANIQIQNGTISATDTTYTAGNGLNLNGTEFSADTDVLATKDDLEDYYTKTETDNLLAPKLESEVVAELPTTGEEGKLYLTPKAHTTQTATGNPITATITEEAGKMESFKLDGDTYQRSYTGKNLCGGTLAQIKNMNSGGTWNGNSYTQAGITWTVYDNADGTIDRIEASGQATENGKTFYIDRFNRQQFEEQLGPEETYTLSGCPQGGSSGYYVRVASTPWKVMLTDRGSTATGTLIPSDDYSSVFVVLCVDTGAGQVNNLVFRPQLELGSTETSYEPYVGGVPSPNPDYPQAIQTVTGEQTVTVVGKNILDYVTGLIASGGGITNTINSDGTITTVGKLNADYRNIIGYYDLTPYLEDGATYTLSSTLYDSKTAAQVRRTKISDSSAHNYDTFAGAKTFTVDKSQYIYRMGIITNTMAQWGDESLTITKGYQLEKSSTGTAFAPYSKHTYEINLGSVELCKLGDYQDYIYKDGEDWKVHKETNKIVVDGSENWQYPDSGTDYTFFQFARSYFKSKYGDTYDFYANNEATDTAKSDNFLQIKASTANMRTEQGFGFSTDGSGWLRVSVPNAIATTVAAFKAWLLSHPTTIDYALATPTDTVITDQTLIAQLEAIRTASLQNGANTITNTATGSNLAGDMEIGYYGYNPRNRYDKWLWLDINNEYEQIGS